MDSPHYGLRNGDACGASLCTLVPLAKSTIGYNPVSRSTYIKHDRATRQGANAMDAGSTEFIVENSEEVRCHYLGSWCIGGCPARASSQRPHGSLLSLRPGP
jgi:hypothetical protein